MSGPQLTLGNWLLGALPMVVLVASILVWRWSAPWAGAVAWLVALGVALLAYGGNATIMAVASAKGLSLSLFMLSIVWTAIYLYNLVERLGGIEAMGRSIARLARDPLVQALLIGWGFASLIQGVTGFGIPVAVATPLLVMMGFPVVRAAAIVLVGHGWAVTFGSMGSSYYTIQLVTGIPQQVLAPHMALLFALPTVATGMVVAHLESGMAGVKRSLPLVLVAGSAMSLALWLTAMAGAPQIASAVAGLVGMLAIALLARSPLLRPSGQRALPRDAVSTRETQLGGRPMGFHLAFLPYYALIALSVVSQIGPVKEAVQGVAWGLDYPGFTTGEGFAVAAAVGYARIRVLNHPAPLIMASLLAMVGVYKATGRWRTGVGWEALRRTYHQSMATTVGVATMVMMALVMADMGMTTVLAQGIAKASGDVFPLASPYIGVLGSFLTGSNTNSNVMFGALQVETAQALEMGTVTIASVQSIGASLGSSLAPAKVMVGAALIGMAGREGEILRMVLVYILGLVALVGIEALVVTTLIPAWSR